MRILPKIPVGLIKANKAYFLFLLALAAGWLMYLAFGHSLIGAMYDGKSLNVLNRLIQYQHKHLLEHYLTLGDFIVIRILFLLFSLGSLVYLSFLLVCSARKVSLFWPILFFTFVLIMVYILNPNHRVYSYHGFYRAGIVYQILNGFIPPPDYLFAGETLRSPWGFPFLTACVSRLLNISPFYSFALLNIISLILVSFLVYRISRLIIHNQRANVFSVLISIFGVTIFCPALISALSRHLQIFLEPRATPAFQKFFNVNGVPIGLVFFFLFIYSTTRIFEVKQIRLHLFYLFVAGLGCGFIYPPMLPGLLAGAGAVYLLLLILKIRNRVDVEYRRIILIAAVSFISLLLLTPYWITISAGVKGGVELAKMVFVARNAIVYSFLSLPILVVIVINRNFLMTRLHRLPFIIVTTFVTANALCYVFIHIPDNAEYKFLLLSTATLGILGGISFDSMRQRFNKMGMLLLLLLLFLPSAQVTYRSLTHLADAPSTYTEKGRYIHSPDREEEELYEWICQKTPKDCVFIDSEPTIPLYAQRRLFIGIDKEDWGTTGYGIPTDYILHVRHGYTMDRIEKRKRIVRKIYNLSDGSSATEAEVRSAFHTFQNVYIVTRKKFVNARLDPPDFSEVFRSSDGTYSVYQYQREEK